MTNKENTFPRCKIPVGNKNKTARNLIIICYASNCGFENLKPNEIGSHQFLFSKTTLKLNSMQNHKKK